MCLCVSILPECPKVPYGLAMWRLINTVAIECGDYVYELGVDHDSHVLHLLEQKGDELLLLVDLASAVHN